MIDYDPHRWRTHLFDIRGSMVREIFYRVGAVVALSIGVAFVDTRIANFGISPTPHMLIGVALGLLLVFRTNASYDRFWEGRKLWGGIVNDSRNFARLICSFFEPEPEARDRLLEMAKSLPFTIMHSLRGKATPTGEHPTLRLAGAITAELSKAKQRGVLSDYTFVQVDQHVRALIDHLGGCERIHKTPLPFAYVVHLRRAILMYCFSLPFVLVNSMHWWSVLATFCIAYIFFGIEEIGVEIEDPFGDDDNDLSLEDICQTITRNIDALKRAED